MVYFDESVKKRDSIWFYQLILNVLIFIAAAIMTGIFIYYNYEYILNPELSPGCSLGLPLEIPAAIVFLVIFWKKNKKGSFISLLLLFIQYIFMFALEMFDAFLFLD